MSSPPQTISATTETIDDLFSYWQNYRIPHNGWNCLFLLPPWLKAWHSSFTGTRDSRIIIFRDNDQIIGAVPLLIDNNTASIIGNPDVCDYSGLITLPGYEKKIVRSLLDYLRSQHINSFIVNGIRRDDIVYPLLLNVSEYTAYTSAATEIDLSFEKTLPPTWQDYLGELTGKQRHEIRRKMRRLEEFGNIALRIIDSPKEVVKTCDAFFQLFLASRKDKARFMDKKMRTFFRLLMQNMSEAGFLRLFFLDIDTIPAAAALCFEYNNTMFLYNSGYDPVYSSLSAGLMCKTLSIQNAIERRCTTYDFLKGQEPYKRRLGGVPIPVYSMQLYLR
jgi:CelD/BcsL family acetyltransferase involved in cellulose biosynthesis